MITHNLGVNQLSPEAYEWYLRYLEAMDRLDLGDYLAFLSDDCRMQFNNGPALVGKAAIAGMLEGYWTSFSEIEHDLLNIYGTDRAFALEAANRYVRRDGARVTVCACAFTDRGEQGLVRSVRLYADASPLFAS